MSPLPSLGPKWGSIELRPIYS